MDATQAISDSILESEEEEDNEEKIQNERRKPLAKLCILNNPHIPEKGKVSYSGIFTSCVCYARGKCA